MSLAWLLLGVALLALPATTRWGSQGETDTVAPAGPSHLSRAAAVVAVGASSVAVLGTVAGLVAAAAACPATWFGLQWLARRSVRDPIPAGDPAVPLVLDLTAAALRAGRPPADAIAAAAPAAPAVVAAAFDRVAGLLRLGAEAHQAWSVLSRDGPLGPVAVVAVRSAASGARLAVAFERLAAELRADAATAAAVRAQRAGVLSMAPLGACFLPSFVLLGVVPVIVGMARIALGTVP